MNLEFLYDLFIILNLIFAAASITIGVLFFIHGTKKLSNFLLLLVSVAIGGWSGSIALFYAEQGLTNFHGLFTILPYLFLEIFSFALLFFVLDFTQNRFSLLCRRNILFFSFFVIISNILFLKPNYIISLASTTDNFIPGPFYGLFILYIALNIFISCYLLFKKQTESAGIFKTILKSILTVLILASSGMLIVDIILPYCGINNLRILGPLLSFSALLFIGSRIFQYHFWDLRSFFTQLFVAIVSFILVAQAVLAKTTFEMIINTILLLLFLVLGYFLFLSVKNDTQIKNETEKLIKDLADANRKLKLLDKRKSEFVKTSAHHLKNPLTAIRGYASMLLDGSYEKDINKKSLEAIQKIFESSRRLIDLIDDFTDISNIESGKMEYVFENVDLKKLIQEILEEMDLAIKKSELKLSFDTDKMNEYVIYADSGKIWQVVSNLIDNAIKYAPKGKVCLFLKKDKKQKKLIFSITDTGIGMSEETIKKLFEKFSRAKGVSNLYTEGLGLGLYVAKEVMKKHNAKIWAESQGEGKGSTFYMEFDAKE